MAVAAKNKAVISKTLESYLEAVYILSENDPCVRITDISLYLGISKPSVNRAVNTLKSMGYVIHEPYSDIMLTSKGKEVGAAVFKRHHVIKKFLVSVLHIPMEQADKEAEKIERGVGQYTVDKMSEFMKNFA